MSIKSQLVLIFPLWFIICLIKDVTGFMVSSNHSVFSWLFWFGITIGFSIWLISIIYRLVNLR